MDVRADIELNAAIEFLGRRSDKAARWGVRLKEALAMSEP
jgi:hypothetical protein